MRLGYLEVFGYGEAARWVYAQAVEPGDWIGDAFLTVTEVPHAHHVAMSKVWEVAPHLDAGPDDGPGAFRRHDIHAFSGGMTPPAWGDVAAEVQRWRKSSTPSARRSGLPGSPLRTFRPSWRDCTANSSAFTPSSTATVGPDVFCSTWCSSGSAIPAIVFKRDRNRYLAALDRADNGDLGALAELIARSVIDNLHRFVVPNIAGPARLVPLRSLASNDVSYDALRQVARRGRLEAELSSDGTWRSSQHAVRVYLEGRHRGDPAR